MVATANGGEVGIWVKLYPRVLIAIFGSFNASTAYPEKRAFSLNAPKNCFGGGCVPLGVGLPRGQISPFLPQKFSMVRIRLLFCMGVNRKHRLCHMVNDSSVKVAHLVGNMGMETQVWH